LNRYTPRLNASLNNQAVQKEFILFHANARNMEGRRECARINVVLRGTASRHAARRHCGLGTGDKHGARHERIVEIPCDREEADKRQIRSCAASDA
jgi:hypothetical protein